MCLTVYSSPSSIFTTCRTCGGGVTVYHHHHGSCEFGDPGSSHWHWLGAGSGRDNRCLSLLPGEARGQGVDRAGGGQGAERDLWARDLLAGKCVEPQHHPVVYVSCCLLAC